MATYAGKTWDYSHTNDINQHEIGEATKNRTEAHKFKHDNMYMLNICTYTCLTITYVQTYVNTSDLMYTYICMLCEGAVPCIFQVSKHTCRATSMIFGIVSVNCALCPVDIQTYRHA